MLKVVCIDFKEAPEDLKSPPLIPALNNCMEMLSSSMTSLPIVHVHKVNINQVCNII